MTRICLALSALVVVATPTTPARAQESERVEAESPRLVSSSDCLCPKEGRWDALNLEGSMDCKGAVSLSKKLGEVRDDGVMFVIEDDCSSVFGDSMDGDEDVLMTRVEEGCGYEGTIEGTHDGVTMVIDLIWTVEEQGFIRGEMSSSTNMGPITCDFFRPYELTFDEPLSEKDYQKWLERVQEKIEKLKKEQ